MKTPDIGLLEIYFKPYHRSIWEYLRCIEECIISNLEGIGRILTLVEWFLHHFIQNRILSFHYQHKAEFMTKDSAGSSGTHLSTEDLIDSFG